MAESVAVTAEPSVEPRPYEPSWLHRAVDWIERLPGPTWLFYLALYVGSTLFWHLVPWSRGAAPVGTIDTPALYWGFLAPALLWIAGYLRRAADRSFMAFRPILRLAPDAADGLRHSLTTIPARPALLITAGSAVLTLSDMSANPGIYTTNVPPPLIVGQFLGQTIYAAILFQLLYWLLRQMTRVRRTLAHDVAIDVFRPGPLHAFATLTARPGIVLSLLVAAGVQITSTPAAFETLIGWAPYLVGPPVVAILAFVLPLMGAHGRLVDQKERLQDDAERRLEAVLVELNRDIDARDLARADGLNKTLASLATQREVLAKLPTWPWSTGTLRGFVSAMLLPMGLFVIQQALSRLF